MKPKQFSSEEIKEFSARFYYDGKDLRYSRDFKGKKAGDLVGSLCQRGYRRVAVLGRKHLVHRIIFYLLTGETPECVDHKDGNTSNNQEDNLRAATKSENCQNKANVAVKGFRKLKSGNYEAYAGSGKDYKYLGTHKTKMQALLARQKYLLHKYGEFATVDTQTVFMT